MALPSLAAAAAPPATGYAHLAITVGTRTDVDALTARMRSDGLRVLSAPRQTGDGYYESVVEDPDGNAVEITAAGPPAAGTGLGAMT
jgi:lactoylglutathione lyase